MHAQCSARVDTLPGHEHRMHGPGLRGWIALHAASDRSPGAPPFLPLRLYRLQAWESRTWTETMKWTTWAPCWPWQPPTLTTSRQVQASGAPAAAVGRSICWQPRATCAHASLQRPLAQLTLHPFNTLLRHVQESRGLMGAFNWLGDRLLAAAHAARSNTLAGSRRNIEEHYDAGGAGGIGSAGALSAVPAVVLHQLCYPSSTLRCLPAWCGSCLLACPPTPSPASLLCQATTCTSCSWMTA